MGARLRIWVRPGSASDRLAWDPWRRCWIVACRAPARGGAANRAVAELLGEWLGEPRPSVRWEKVGASRAKVLVVDGLDDAEVDRRLRSRRVAAGSP